MECEKGAICSCVYCAHLSFECSSVFGTRAGSKWEDLFTDRLPVVLVILPSCQNKQDVTHVSVEPIGVELPFWCLFQAVVEAFGVRGAQQPRRGPSTCRLALCRDWFLGLAWG